MKLAKATQQEVDALLNLMRVLNSHEEGDAIPCKPNGEWEPGEDGEWFDPNDKDHLRKFYDRVTACFADLPGGLSRTIGGFHLAWTNDVFDPAADTYEWHPSLVAAVEARNKAREEIEVLRTYGNKDCTAMADEELARRRANTERSGASSDAAPGSES